VSLSALVTSDVIPAAPWGKTRRCSGRTHAYSPLKLVVLSVSANAMKHPSLLITIVASYVIACGGNTRGPANVIDGAEADLSDCAFLQKVKGTASDTDSHAAGVARRKAKAEAAAIGATHIKWIVPCCTYVEADAYQCDTPDYAQASL
jgi:hypothetical protein